MPTESDSSVTKLRRPGVCSLCGGAALAQLRVEVCLPKAWLESREYEQGIAPALPSPMQHFLNTFFKDTRLTLILLRL